MRITGTTRSRTEPARRRMGASDRGVGALTTRTTQPGPSKGPRLYHVLVMEGETGECPCG
jgi:hypothetical protein